VERPPFVLASGSPRRRELLSRLFGEHGFRWTATGFDEDAAAETGDTPAEQVLRIADGKREAWTRGNARDDLATCFVLSADTVVEIDGRILGKPKDEEEARGMLRILSGRRHEVVTGLSLAFVREGRTERVLRHVEATAVVFAPLEEELVDWYVATGEPLDKAGAYGIQGHGALLVERIEGCYYNVMGLPIRRLFEMIRTIEDLAGFPGLVSPSSPMPAGGMDGRRKRTGDGTARHDPKPAGERPPV
jgi:septum formation protein